MLLNPPMIIIRTKLLLLYFFTSQDVDRRIHRTTWCQSFPVSTLMLGSAHPCLRHGNRKRNGQKLPSKPKG